MNSDTQGMIVFMFLILCGTGLIVLFGGEPDIHDKILNYMDAQTQVMTVED